MITTMQLLTKACNRVLTLLLIKIYRAFQGLSRTIKKFFHDFLEAREWLNIKTIRSYLLYIQSVMQQST